MNNNPNQYLSNNQNYHKRGLPQRYAGHQPNQYHTAPQAAAQRGLAANQGHQQIIGYQQQNNTTKLAANQRQEFNPFDSSQNLKISPVQQSQQQRGQKQPDSFFMAPIQQQKAKKKSSKPKDRVFLPIAFERELKGFLKSIEVFKWTFSLGKRNYTVLLSISPFQLELRINDQLVKRFKA